MTRTLALSAFVAACMLSGCNKSEPETTPEPSAAAAPAKDSTMAGEKMSTDSSKMMTDSTKMMTDSTMSMPADSTMSMPADSTKQ